MQFNMIKWISLVSLALCALLAVGQSDDKGLPINKLTHAKAVPIYNKINKMLERDYARREKHGLLARDEEDFSDDFEVISQARLAQDTSMVRSEATLTAYLMFLELENYDDEKCTFGYFKNLRFNTYAAGLRSPDARQKVPAELKPKRRLETIVHHYSMKHARECQSVYADKLDYYLKRMMSVDRARVEALQGKLVESRIERLVAKKGKPVSFGDGELAPMLSHVSLDLHEDLEVILRELKRRAKSNSDPQVKLLERGYEMSDDMSGYSVEQRRRVEIREMVKQYLMMPAFYYWDFMKEIYMPTEFENPLLDSQLDELKYKEFYLNWAKFRLCSDFLNQLEDITTAIFDYTANV